MLSVNIYCVVVLAIYSEFCFGVGDLPGLGTIFNVGGKSLLIFRIPKVSLNCTQAF